MNEKERVLTLASAARMTGVEQDTLKSLIDEGKLESVKTEGGNLLISESSLKLIIEETQIIELNNNCLLYTSPSPRDRQKSRMPSSA